MDPGRLPVYGFGFVGVAHLAYVSLAIQFGALGLGAVFDGLSALGAFAAAAGLLAVARGQGAGLLGLALVGVAAVKVVDFTNAYGVSGAGVGTWTLGFGLVLLGALANGAAGWRWRSAPSQAASAVALLRAGAALGLLGSLVYLGLGLGRPGIPPALVVGPLLAVLGWAAVAAFARPPSPAEQAGPASSGAPLGR